MNLKEFGAAFRMLLDIIEREKVQPEQVQLIFEKGKIIFSVNNVVKIYVGENEQLKKPAEIFIDADSRN